MGKAPGATWGDDWAKGCETEIVRLEFGRSKKRARHTGPHEAMRGPGRGETEKVGIRQFKEENALASNCGAPNFERPNSNFTISVVPVQKKEQIPKPIPTLRFAVRAPA